jgi:hypothetical protein
VFQERETTGFDAFHGAVGVGPNPGGSPVAAQPGQPPELSMDPDSLRAEVLLSTIVDFSPISPKELLNFMTIETGPARKDPFLVRDEEQSLEQTLADLTKAFPYLQAMLSSGAYTMDVIALKQFRGFPDIESAVYQSLSQRTYKYTSVTNMKYYNPKDVEITFYPTDMTRQIINEYLDLPLQSLRYGAHVLNRIEQDLHQKSNTPISDVPETDRSPSPFAFCFEATLDPGAIKTLYTYG